MLYSLTDKLKFEDNPRIEIKGTIITVQSDAETVLKLMDIVNNEGEISAMIKAVDLLFSEKDRELLRAMKLSMKDFSEVVSVAMQLASGEDPDEINTDTE